MHTNFNYCVNSLTTPPFFKNCFYLSPYVPKTSDGCRSWFHLYGLSRPVSKGATIWFLWGAGRLKWAGEFFFAYFWSRRIFFAGPSGRTIFLKPPRAHFIKPWRGGGGVSIHALIMPSYLETFLKSKILPFYDATTHFQSIMQFLERVKQFTDCEKQILDCERFRTVKGGFWSAKTCFGVRKRFLRQAGEFLLPVLWAGEFFYLKSEPEIIFCEVFLPPPHKNQMVAP